MAKGVYFREYESVFIIRPDVDESGINQLVERLKGVIKGKGGVVLKQENWGKRTLAYPIKKHKTGHYVLLNFAGPAGVVEELERNYKMIEAVIRFMTIKLRDRVRPEELVPASDAPITSLEITGPSLREKAKQEEKQEAEQTTASTEQTETEQAEAESKQTEETQEKQNEENEKTEE